MKIPAPLMTPVIAFGLALTACGTSRTQHTSHRDGTPAPLSDDETMKTIGEAFALVGSAGTQLFLNIDGVKGAPLDTGAPKDALEISTWAWGATNTVSIGAGGAGGGVAHGGKVVLEDFSWTMPVGPASPVIFADMAGDKSPKTAALTVVVASSGNKPAHPVVKLTFSNVFFTAQKMSGDGESLHESDAMHFTKVQVQVMKYRADGSLDTTVSAGWDIAANKAF